MTHKIENDPGWVRGILLACFVYYFISGLWLFWQPVMIFELLGMPLPNYPWLVQFAGLLTALFGFIFIPPSRAPRRFFSSIVIGFVAQIAIPIFTLLCFLNGQIPAALVYPMVAIDLTFAALLMAVINRVKCEK